MTRLVNYLLTAALIVSLMTIGISYAGGKSKDQPKDKGTSGSEAPQFTLTNYDGRDISLADFDGKIVVLEWLNYDCPFVKYHYETASTMVDLVNKYADKGVVWLAINSTNYATAEANKDFAEKHAAPYPILDDHKGDVGHAYNATNTPDMFVINKDGLIVYQGAIDNAPFGRLNEGAAEKINYVDKALAELLAGKELTVPQTKPYGCTVKYAK